MTNDQIADRIILLRSNADSQPDEDETAGARLRLARFVIEHENEIVAALRQSDKSSE